MKTRRAYLDRARVLAFACIIFYHITIQLVLDGRIPLEAAEPLYRFRNINIAAFGVQLFFLISGAGLMLSCLRIPEQEHFWADFYKKRFFRILVPFYIVWAGYFL